MEKQGAEILIIGAGFAGIGMGIKLLEAGMKDFIILEQADEIGGTWRDNTYPGAACDIASHLYSFSFAPNPDWSRMYSGQEEIQRYLLQVTEQYGLRPWIRFGAQITAADFQVGSGKWTLETSSGRSYRGRFCINAMGPLNREVFPDIPGRNSFPGISFHSSRWRHDAGLEGKRVGVIGTGASAIQIVPEIAGQVGQLHLFQRTAPWIIPKRDRPMRPWEIRLFRALPFTQKMLRNWIYLKNELTTLIFTRKPELTRIAAAFAQRYMGKQVKDPALREKLTPDYNLGCKRVLLSNDYYPALSRENVALHTEGIAEITEKGIRLKDGTEIALDVLIYCTGFMASEYPDWFKVQGLPGHELSEEWSEGPEGFLGTTVSGYPNLFFLIGPNTGLGSNSMIVMIEAQIRYILDILRTARQKGIKYLDVKPEVQELYNETLQSQLKNTVWTGGCVSWYQTSEGKNTSIWPDLTLNFRRKTREVNPEDYHWVK